MRVSPSMRLFAAAMLRNENDVILPFLRQCAELFDGLLVADIQSTDGTTDILKSFADPRLEIRVFAVDREEKFQSALMNRLSREAFALGADWVFLLDADEFIEVPSRMALEQYLHEANSDVLMLPWINLVPTKYGTYNRFDPAQEFHWSGRSSKFAKVVVSSLYAANNPDYYIHEGNHTISPTPTTAPIWDRPGLPLLHVPIRSHDRFSLKISAARRITQAKHNRGHGEGSHVYELEQLLSDAVEEAELNYMAANYGEPVKRKETLQPRDLGWPSRRLPSFVACDEKDSTAFAPTGLAGLSQTLRADAQLIWDQSPFVKDTSVCARIEGEHIRIVPQPMFGNGKHYHDGYGALGSVAAVIDYQQDLLIEVATIASMRIKAWVFSAWSELIPVLYALFVLLRPRRFAELGVHNGMSFFAACQITERLGLKTECIAVDSWIGDEHAGFHDTKVFDEFRAYLAKNYPDQQYIQGYFPSARRCFDDGSLDLLHIDGLHTYEAVKRDFETWLPALSDVGVIILHDINVFERGFGVWRLWQELKEKYPAYGFAHKHGLGIVFVGREPHPFAALLRNLADNRLYNTLVQAYFESIGTLLIEYRSTQASLNELRSSLPGATSLHHNTFLHHATGADEEVARLRGRLAELQQRFDRVIHSTSWRATGPLRSFFNRAPRSRRVIRRTAKLTWWTITGQLPRRLRERRKAAR